MRLLVALGLGLGLAVGCGNPSAPSPFVASDDAGADAAAPTDGGIPPIGTGVPDSGLGEPGEWGGPCLDDGECDDGIDCTADACDPGRSRCHFSAADPSCDDGAYCNGAEHCALGIGCRPGEPVACSDGTACTIDACDEATHSCVHSSRDADGDGDSDGNCPGGGDCDERNPNVSSVHVEICGDAVDNDCDGNVDETGCEQPSHDVCADPLEVSGPGSFELSAAAAKQDYSASCLSSAFPFRDLVVALRVPEGEPMDVDMALTATSGNVALAAASTCGDASTETACSPGVTVASQGYAARLVLRGLVPGVYPLYVFSEASGPLGLKVGFSPASPAPANETCGKPVSIEPGRRVVASLAGTTRDVTTACGTNFGDLVYSFTLADVADVHLFATAEDAYGTPILSLRRDPCDGAAAELTCRTGQNAELFWRALPAGRYFVSVGASGPSDVSLLLETDPPTTAPADENCAGAPVLTPSETRDVDLAHHEDDVQLGCAVGAPDAAYALTLAEASDVLLVLGVSNKDQGSVSLVAAACLPEDPLLACATSNTTPVRAVARDVFAGEYRVVVESDHGSPASIAALVRPASPPSLVAFADTCDGAQPISVAGGLFKGNTANAADDFTASCDVGGASGAPDQILSLHLDVPSRVVLDAKGSAYAVIVDVRQGAACPGDEVSKACSAGYVQGRSFLDLDLPSGDYWVQIDGYDGAAGAWVLDVFIAPT